MLLDFALHAFLIQRICCPRRDLYIPRPMSSSSSSHSPASQFLTCSDPFIHVWPDTGDDVLRGLSSTAICADIEFCWGPSPPRSFLQVRVDVFESDWSRPTGCGDQVAYFDFSASSEEPIADVAQMQFGVRWEVFGVLDCCFRRFLGGSREDKVCPRDEGEGGVADEEHWYCTTEDD